MLQKAHSIISWPLFDSETVSANFQSLANAWHGNCKQSDVGMNTASWNVDIIKYVYSSIMECLYKLEWLLYYV